MLNNFFKNSKYGIFVIFVILFCLQVILLGPKFDFPLNDDWSHTLSIYHFNFDKELFYAPWLSAFNYVPIFFGIFLTGIFGFSFSILRFGNLIISFSTVYLFFVFLRYNKIPKLHAFLLSLLLWFNPIFFYLSYTFMGDQIALLLVLLSIFLYKLAIDKRKYNYIFFASIASVFAIFTRQFVAILPFVAFVYFFFSKQFNKKRTLLSFLPSLFLLIIFYYISLKLNFIPGEVSARFVPRSILFRTIVFNFVNYILLLSLFFIPITLSTIKKDVIKKMFSKRNLILILLMSLFFILTVFYKKFQFPGLGNIINLYGIGPNTTIMQGDIDFNINYVFIFIVNILLVTLSIFNIFYFFENREIILNKVKNDFFWIVFLFLYLFLILPIMSFDRYLLIFVPFILLFFGMIMKEKGFSKTILILLIFIQATLVFVGTRDYLFWNKARWNIARELSKVVETKNIEAGYEWDGWNFYKKQLFEEYYLGKFTPTWAPWYVKQVSKNHQMEYIVSFSELGGYEVIKKQETKTILSPIEHIYLNKVSPNSINL